MGMPMIFISLCIIIRSLKKIKFQQIKVLNLHMISDLDNIYFQSDAHKCDANQAPKKDHENCDNEKKKTREIFYIFSLANFIVNFLVVFLIANIQIINRVITSNPLIYVFCSEVLVNYKNSNNGFGKFVLIIFIAFSIVGCIMQSASYGYA